LLIPDPGPDFLPIPDPGVKKSPDPGFGSATLPHVDPDPKIGQNGSWSLEDFRRGPRKPACSIFAEWWIADPTLN